MTTLYHYCSNEAFHSIIEKRTIRLFSLSLSNDSMEGKLVSSILTRIAKDDGFAQPDLQRLQEKVDLLEQAIDGLGFCLSEDGDLLSQWRAYAADASGVSIGFSKEYLEQLSEEIRNQKKSYIALQKVEYNPEDQQRLLEPTYVKIKEAINGGAFRVPALRGLLDVRSDEEREIENKRIKDAFSRLLMTVLPLVSKLFLLKTDAFREEREWRLISYFIKTVEDTCLFRVQNNRIIPFREFELLALDRDPIVEVILGSKNMTPNYVIESFLKQRGVADVKISHSKATYR